MAAHFLAQAKAAVTAGSDSQLLNRDLHSVLQALKSVAGHTPINFEQINAASGVDLVGYVALVERLRESPKVVFHGSGDTALLAYTPLHKLSTKEDLLDLVEHSPEGLRVADIEDSYDDVHEHVEELIATAAVRGIRSTDSSGMVLFPRKGRLICQLSGTVSVEQHGTTIVTSHDLRDEIARGDCIVINGFVCRVCSNTTDKHPGEQTQSIDRMSYDSGAGFSASSTRPHKIRSKHCYRYNFTETELPLAAPFAGETVKDVPVFKYGFTNDVRQLWHKMSSDAGWPGDVSSLKDQMRRDGFDMTKTRFQVVAPVSKKRKRQRRAPRNFSSQMAYLHGTSLGEALLAQHQKVP